MSELTKEICKDFRQRNNRECILDEITDVSIMLEQLIMIYDFKPNELSKQKQMKLLRLQRTIETIEDFSRS
nr:MAG TPA: nucleoside triphosphate pyrophosphohydrolase [Caudoviricetes sp.]